MTLNYVPNVWASDSDDTDCQVCGIRFFAECVKCKKIACTWCSFMAEGEELSREFLCETCLKKKCKHQTVPTFDGLGVRLKCQLCNEWVTE